MHRELDVDRRSLTAVLIAAALLLVGSGGATAAADSAEPQLSIAVDDGSASAESGDELGYAVTLTNLGPKKVKDLRVSQTLPVGASFVSADSGGDQAKGKISWSVDLAAAEKITMHATMALGATPASTLRLATVACAQVSAKGPALVCASDSDQLPAGAAVERAEADAAPVNGRFDGCTGWLVGGGAAAALAAVGAVLLVGRRRGPDAGAPRRAASSGSVGGRS